LGVSSEDLRNAMRDAGGRNADLSVVAEKLGVSEEALRAALFVAKLSHCSLRAA